MLISPSMLSSDFSRLGEEARRIDRAGADLIHLDVMDGNFVSTITFGAQVISSIRPYTEKFFDVHMMVAQPQHQVGPLARAGANGITFHLEAEGDPAETIRFIHLAGCRAGIALKPATPVESLFPLLPDLDLVLVMTVEPGAGGQKFIPSMLEKVRAVRARDRAMGLSIPVEIDGGVTFETVGQAARAGVDICVSGTTVFGAQNPAEAIGALKQIAAEAAAEQP